jgi:anti-anti-sigma factor
MNDKRATVDLSGLYFDLHVDYPTRQIAVEGELEVACAPNVATAVARLQRAAPGDITIRLDGVRLIDMPGLGILVGARSAQTDRGDRLILTGASPQVRQVFHLGAQSHLLDTI